MDRAEALWRELQDCREDERQAQAALVTILIGSTAVYGAVGFLLYSPSLDRGQVPNIGWYLLPLIPLGLTGWFAYVVSQIVVRGRYIEALEHQLRNELDAVIELHDDPAKSLSGTAKRSLPIPAAHGLLLSIGSVTRGNLRMSVVLSVGLFFYQVLPLGLLVLSMANMDGLLPIVGAGLTYVPFVVLTSYTIALNGLAGGKVWSRAATSHRERTT